MNLFGNLESDAVICQVSHKAFYGLFRDALSYLCRRSTFPTADNGQKYGRKQPSRMDATSASASLAGKAGWSSAAEPPASPAYGR